MKAPQKRLSKGAKRHQQDIAVVAYSSTVAVTFRLYDKLASDGKGGAFKQTASRSPHKRRPKSEPFWLYLFQDSGDQIHLAHEVFVDENGFYRHPEPANKTASSGSSQESVLPTAVLLQRTFLRNTALRYYSYYVLLSPFRMPRSRIAPVLPDGKTPRGDQQARRQFLSWAQLRELNQISFSPSEGAYGAVRCLWAPWLKAQALADQYDAVLHQFAREYVDQTDEIELANLIARLSRLYPLENYVSTSNIQALFNVLPRIMELSEHASRQVTEYIATNPFADMLLDMWEDKSGVAFITVAPYLANIYRAANKTQLRDMVDKRYFDLDLDWQTLDIPRAVRRILKPLWEIHACFAKALKHQAAHPDARLDWYVQASRKYSEKLFKIKIDWDGQRAEWNLRQVAQLKRGRYIPAIFNVFLGFLDAYNSYAALESFKNDQGNPRAYTALMSAYVSQISNFLRIIDLTLPEASEISLKKAIVRLRGGNVIDTVLSPAEEAILRRLSRREAVVVALRSGAITRPLGFVGGFLDAFTAYFDLRSALQTANTSAAIFNAMALLGGICVAAAAILTGQVFWLAFVGQTLLLAGSLGSAFSQNTHLELWLKFCKFGVLSASNDVSIPTPWADGLTLGSFAKASVRTQIEAYKKIVYQAETSARRICPEKVDDLFEFSVKFPYGVPRLTDIYCRVELLREDGSTLVARPFSPLRAEADTVIFRYSDSTKETVMGLLVLFREADVLFATEAITVTTWMDITGAYDFYPHQAIVNTFRVDKLPRT